MSPLPCCLATISSREELAKELNVDIKSLDLVELTDTPCRSEGCNLSAAKNNYNQCILCCQQWFPRKLNKGGEVKNNRRGYGLYGPQFMQRYNGTTQRKACACDMEECQKIGYSHYGMMTFPTDQADCKEAIRVLGIRCPVTKANILANPRSYRIAPWHYQQNHLQKNNKGNWSIRSMEKYTDSDGKAFSFAPPNGNVIQFIESFLLPMGHDVCRGGVDVLPSWVKTLAALQASNQQQHHNGPTPSPTNKTARVMASLSSATPRPARKRPSPDKAEIEELTAKAALLEVRLNSALNHNYNLEAKVKVLDGENIQLRLENTKLKKENAELRGKVEELEGKNCVISYDDLKPGGMLADYVNSFTFFPTFETNDLFLEIINGDIGVCERIKRYHHVTVEERVKYNNEIRAKMEQEKKNNEAGGNGGGEAGEDLDVIMAEASLEGNADNLDEVMAEANINGTQRTRHRKLHWKTEYLVYCFFARCNISMTRIAALFGIGRILVHDIVYGWANMLADTLAQFFPVPTRSQMLRAYPKSVIKKFGHAHIFMLLDATEIFAEVASMKSVNAILYSAYKHHSTLKWLVGCDPIGTVWNDSISEGYPGAISDPIQTIVTNILEQIPFGCAVEVDKGFLIENECAFLGIHCVRPMKMLTGQMQQSKEDVALTQKVGKTRIPVEQVNGQMKNSASFFDKRIRLDQIGLADLICRVSYLLQNFKLGFIQQHDGTKKDRPCKAHIRWYDGEDDGLIDIRPYVEMWGTTSEINRWRELADMPENKDATNLEISEMVLAEDWPTRLRKEHIERLA